ncbi:MAG TPA: MFS transporter [Caulobacteraceae bacterium]|jgi:GPH family glycoside/pentoside/hexuronide:cation symporter|nr:MFS transporter [Caulobacteraceae bacterium]
MQEVKGGEGEAASGAQMAISETVNPPAAEIAQADAGHAQRAGRLGRGLLGVYASGALVETTINFALTNFLLFYLTIVCGLSGTLAGAVGLISLAIDACIDPLIGSLSDNLRSPLGRRHPFLIGASVPAGLALVLIFSIPTGMTGVGLFAYATVLSLALRFGLSAFQVPYYALGAELSEDYVERSTIVAFRLGLAVLGTLAATILSYRIFLAGPGGTLHRAAYTPMAWCFAAIIMASGLVAGIGTLGARSRLHGPPPPGPGAARRFFAELGEIFRNRSFRVLFASLLLFFVAQGVAGPLTLHANTYFWLISTKQIGDLTLIYTAGLAGGIVLTGLAARKLEKRTLVLTGLTFFILAGLVPAPLRVAGLLASPASVMATLTVAVIFLGVGVSFAVIGFQSMMADAADEHEHLFGARREGLYFAGINFSAKTSSGLGVLIAGIVLDLIGFPHGLAGATHAHLARHTVVSLGLIYGPGAATVSMTAMAILLGYKLDKARHTEILRALGRAPAEMA